MTLIKALTWQRTVLLLAVFVAIFAVACGASEPQPAAETTTSEPAAAAQPAAPAAEPAAPAAPEPASQQAVPTDARALTETRRFESTPTPVPAAQASATATPIPTPTPGAAFSAKDTIYLVTQEEPVSLGTFSDGCSGNVPSMICEEIATDPFTLDRQQQFRSCSPERCGQLVPG